MIGIGPPKRVAWLPLCLALACCACLSRERLTPQRFVLEVPRPAPALVGGQGTLLLERVRVSPLFEHQPFVVRTGDTTYAEDHYHGFFTPPGPMLREVVAAWLEQAGLFGRVVAGDHRGVTDFTLDGRVLELYLDLRDPGQPAAVLELEFVLYDPGAAPLREAFRGRYTEVVLAAGADASSLLAAWRDGLARILQRLEADLRVAVAPTGPAS